MEGHNILHKALMGIANAEMVEILLHNKPSLIKEKDKENLTPLMFGEKYGFGKAASEKEIRKIKKVLESYEQKIISDHSNSENFTSEQLKEPYYDLEHQPIIIGHTSDFQTDSYIN